jgi:hypothetical protein
MPSTPVGVRSALRVAHAYRHPRLSKVRRRTGRPSCSSGSAGSHDRVERRRPRAVVGADGLGLDQPHGDAFGQRRLSELAEVLGDGGELVAVLEGDDDEASCAAATA